MLCGENGLRSDPSIVDEYLQVYDWSMFVVSEDILAWIGTLSLNFTLRLNIN